MIRDRAMQRIIAGEVKDGKALSFEEALFEEEEMHKQGQISQSPEIGCGSLSMSSTFVEMSSSAMPNTIGSMSSSTCVQSTSAPALQSNVPSMINSTCVQSTCSAPALQSNVSQVNKSNNPAWDDDFWASSAGIEGVEKLIKEHIERRMESASLSKVSKVVNHVHLGPSFENISNCPITIVNVLDPTAATNVLSEFRIPSWFELSKAKVSSKDNIENIPPK